MCGPGFRLTELADMAAAQGEVVGVDDSADTTCLPLRPKGFVDDQSKASEFVDTEQTQVFESRPGHSPLESSSLPALDQGWLSTMRIVVWG